MKSLATLLKLARRELEALRGALGATVQRQTVLEALLRGHDETVLAEQRAAARDYESGRCYGGYAAASVARRRALQSERDAVLAEAEALRARVAEAHVEARKFERLIELAAARERHARARRENAELDEIATQRAARARPAE